MDSNLDIFKSIRDPNTRLRDIIKDLPPPTEQNEEILLQCRMELTRRLGSTEWDITRVEQNSDEVAALYPLIKEYGEVLVDEQLVTALFQSKNFNVPVGDLTLGLLNYLVNLPVQHPLEMLDMEIPLELKLEKRQLSSHLQRAVASWANRLFRVAQNLEPVQEKKKKRGILSGLTRGRLFGLNPEAEAEALEEQPLPVLLTNLLNWWSGNCKRLRGERNQLIQELEWVMVSHMSSICLAGPLFVRETLNCMGIAVGMCNNLPPELQRSYVEVLCSSLRLISPIEVFKIIYPERQNMEVKAISKQHPWQRYINRRIMAQLLENITHTQANSGDDASEFLKLEAFLKHGAAWPLFIYWFGQQKNSIRKEKVSDADIVNWKRLEEFFMIGKTIFMNGYSSMVDGTAPIIRVRACVEIKPEDIMELCWKALDMNNAVKQTSTLNDEILKHKDILEKLIVITKIYMDGSETQKQVLNAQKNWDNMQLQEMRVFFRTQKFGGDIKQLNYPPLDAHFLAAWNWLYSLKDSELFKLVWSEQKGKNDLEKLIPASKAWKLEYARILQQTTTFKRMRKIAPILNARDERKYFCNSAPGFSSKDGKPVWKLIASKKKVKTDMRTLVKEWLHLFAVHQNIKSIIRVLNCLDIFIKATGIPSLDIVKNAAYSLESVFEKEVFNDKTIAEQPRFIPDSEKIDPCFVRLNPDLFEGIVKCMGVLDWLRELTDDENFKSGIEEAMGKSEMECPVELWQEEENKPGRVDEEKLSMLSAVRGYLHDLIYRSSDRLDNLQQVILILAELRATDENIIKSLYTANEYRVPLRELLDAKSEGGAPDRLLQLLLPIRKTKWICKTENEFSTNGEIWLRWEIKRGGKVTEKKQNLNELMDFQSSIVLAKTDQQGPDVLQAIDSFIQQFGWIRMLNDNLSSLLQAGHFDFQKFDVSFDFNVDPDNIREEAVRCKNILDSWVKQVELERNSNYFLNFYSMKHIWRLVSTIRSLDEKAIEDIDDSPNYDIMKDILCLLNPDYSRGGVEVSEFTENFYKLWYKKESKDNILNAFEALSLCGNCLEEIFKDAQIRHRPINVADVANYPAGADIYKGLNILCADNSQCVYDHILSAYARAGYLPERELIYVCRETTTWDDLYTLLLRWARSHEHGRTNKFYCLASIEAIPFELQRKAVIIIRENLSSAKNPLLVISGNADKQHLVAQFAHCRTSVIPLPEDIIQKFSNEISEKYSRGVNSFVSPFSGAGKTFNIKQKAAAMNSNYVPISIMHASNVLENIHLAIKERDLKNEDDYITLHLDLYDTAVDELNPLLFDLIFLGGIEDNKTGKQYFWNADLATISVEVATGNLVERLRICALLAQQIAVVNGDTFCISKRKLEQGMGTDFYSPRNDGTSIAANSSSKEELNAHVRLQYVCMGLDIMDNNQGRFPFVFEKPGVSVLDSLRESQTYEFINKSATPKVPAHRCFKLLMNALELEKPSLWCIWNFVNVFYWQLRDMHHPDSPINCACMPDPNSDRTKGDEQAKAKFKGEVVQFLIRTAREFATRQVKEVTTDSIKGVFITGMSRQEFNGLWERMECENDGKPAFQKRSSFGNKNFIYYRKEENAWVIDDIIDTTGPVYSRCEKGNNIDGQWSTTPEWAENPKIKVEKIKNKKGYNGEGVRVSGCTDGGSISRKENGVYLRQPPYDDINKNPHYILHVDKKTRRHIFVGNDHGWQICPICTDEEGTYCMSSSKNITGRWRAIPPDKIEDRGRVKFITEEEYQDFVRKPATSYARAEIRDREKERREALALRDSLRQSVGVEEEEEEETMEQLWDNTLKWNDSNHECVLFSNRTHVVSFLSLDPERLRNRMHPGLLKHLEKNGINVGEDLDIISSRFHEILAALTEVNKTQVEAKQILGGKYCLTGDSLLKMLAIFARLRCGVPVVLMGECGCGKTMLIKYLCAWMSVKLFILDVHGGTSEKDIMGVFNLAHKELESGKSSKVFVFLDEINTCAHMGLMCEVICHRTLYGKRLHDNIYVLAALNPYRRRPDAGNIPGLVFQLQGGANIPPDPMADLVYRVHPIPKTLRDFIFDFGALTPTNEKTYILSMVKDKLTNASQFIVEHIGNLIHYSQQYIRKVEKDDSSASLRDVRRCLNLISWFLDIVQHSKGDTKLSPLACCTTLALAFVYYYRLSTIEHRDGYWKQLGTGNAGIQWKSKEIEDGGFGPLKPEGAFVRLLKHFQKFVGGHVVVEDGIAMNDALMENLFVVIICILTRIPIFVVGKPGSSKTLTMQVIASNLQGKQSPMEFWRRYPAVYIFPYQCSPMSDSHSIQHQFDMAVRYQQHSENTITVLLLDEVGLAEHSPDMPLKVLHGMLVDPPIAVVGLSNWVLDPAKMNRAILLQRTEPSKGDIQLTGKSIVSSGKSTSGANLVDQYLQPLAEAYHEIYTGQKGRDFVGMRDYYNLVKLLRAELTKAGKRAKFTPTLLTDSLCRNFGGKRELIDKVLKTFHTKCFGNTKKLKISLVTNLIRSNLEDQSARHLMLLTKNSAALSLMFGCKLLDERTTKVLVGSEFKDDRTELHLITQINEVKLAMAEGSRLVLLNHDNIYEALYDVLNQRYLYKKDHLGNVKKMLRLAIGSRSQLCTVADGFKIVVIVEQDHAYRNLDLPLLNRFEKQVLCGEDVLGPNQNKLVVELTKWVDGILDVTGLGNMQEVFCGFHPGTIPSAVLNISNFDDSQVSDNTIDILKIWLTQVARPIAVMNSNELKSLSSEYFTEHSCLSSALKKYIYPSENYGSMCITLTHSPISHFDEAISVSPLRCPHQTMQLGELTSERQLYSHLRNFFSEDDANEKVLVVQCDPIACRQSLINHARYVCMKQRSEYEHEHRNEVTPKKRHIIFLIHLPPGTKQRSRFFALDFISPWTYIFVDDLRKEDKDSDSANTVTLLTTSVYDLIQKGIVKMKEIYKSRFQHALSTCIIPEVDNPAAYFGNRINTLKKLLEVPAFTDFVEETMLKILEKHSGMVKISEKEDAVTVPIHVRMVCEELVGGSLRQSLDIAIQTLIIQAFSHVLRYIDNNFNLATIWQEGKEKQSEKLWFSLLASSTIIESSNIANHSNIGEHAFVGSEPVRNTGIIEPFVSRFPFSSRIIPLLNERSTRDQVETVNADPQETLHNLLPSLFGEEIVNNWTDFGNNEHTEYLYDFVATATIPIPGAIFKSISALYEHVIRVTRPDSLVSVAGIHAAVWENETRLFRCGSLVSNNQIPLKIREQIIEQVKSIDPPKSGADVSSSAIKERLAVIDFSVLSYLLSTYWARIKEDSLYNYHDISSWISEFSSIRSDIELYLLSLKDYENQTLYKNITLLQLRNSFLGLRTIQIYFQEVLQELYIYDEPAKQPIELIELAEDIQLTSIPFVKKIITSYYKNIEIIERRYLGVSFLRRYLQEIVFGEQEGFYNIGSNHELPTDFLSNLESIFANKPSEKEFCALVGDLSLRRALLRCLLQANHSLKLEGTEALQLYLQYCADNVSDITEWRKKDIVSNNDFQLSSENPASCKTRKDQLESLSRVQMCILEYARLLINPNDLPYSSYMFKMLETMLKTKESYHHRVFALKCIKNSGGIDSLAEIIQAPEKLDWMPLNKDMAANSKISLPDPFVWLTSIEQYEQVCGAVRSCVTQSSKQTLQLDKLKFDTIGRDVIGGSIFSQISVERSSVFAKGSKVLNTWLDKKLSDKTEKEYLNWLSLQCPNIEKALPITKLEGMCLLQIAVNLSLWALVHPDTWIYGLFFESSAHKKSFLVSCPDDEFAEVVKASGRVGWYICPNGHKYSVGQCTMPMQRARCPTCGSDIGGSNHVSVKGVRRLDDAEIRGDPDPGYSIENNESVAIRMSPLGSRVLRFILHISLLTSCSLSDTNFQNIQKLLSSEERKVDPVEFLSRRTKHDWKLLKEMTGHGDGDLTLAMHLVIRRIRKEIEPAKGITITTSVTRNREEVRIAKIVEQIFSDKELRKKIEDTRSALQDDNTMSAIRLATGEKLWYEIHEEQYSEKESPDLQTLLWRYREPVSFDHFLTFWRLQPSEATKRYSLLRTLLREEKRLHSIQGVRDILAWHSILFETIPHMSISRTDAIDVSNKDIIGRLPKERQKEANEIFARYCDIFNEILPTIELLYECNENPFILEGKVNLGGKQQMCLETSVAFSLPSMVTGSDGGDFINGMCTIRILEILIDSQNEVLEAIAESGQRKKGGFKRYPGGAAVAANPVAADQPREIPKVPAVSYRTPSSILENQLLVYNRERDFLPLLRMFSEQSLLYNEGGDLSYNLDMIESALANGLLSGKRQINLCISHYQYSGDVKRMGQLALLGDKLPQDKQLPSSFKEALLAEIDTQNQTMRLLQILEVCIQFIVSIGSSSVKNFDGRTNLSSYVINTLHIDQKEWEDISTPTIRQQMCLRNIEPLYLLLESQLNGNPLDDVFDVYRENLTEEQELNIKTASTNLDVSMLTTCIHDFMIQFLTTAQNMQPPECDLKEYLGYFKDLNCEDWWDDFPEGLEMRHIFSIYELLTNC